MLDNGSNNIGARDYYGAFAYRSHATPPQENQWEELNRSRLERSASLRLPWGNTREVIPPNFMSDTSPKKLRKLEKKEDLAEKYGLQVENSHECFRHAPEWEFNRRTGMIKVWQYSRKFPFWPAKPPVVTEKPFYEFDAWCCARVDRHGTLFDLVLSHRYSKLDATVGDILGAHGSASMCYAYWDFIQNYMDVTRPLPELPMLERYRPLDPITAESDRKADRPPRHWRDMDDETFKKKVSRMFTGVSIINTAQRPNLMEEKLSYAF